MGTIGTHARRVIEALDQGRILRRNAEEWRGRGLVAPLSLIEDLKRRDLVRENGDTLALTEAGVGWSARTARPDLPNRMLAERALPRDGEAVSPRTGAMSKRARSVTVNLAESPLGWLKARGLVNDRQFDAGERLRADWEMAGLGARVTMRWGDAPPSGVRRGPAQAVDPTIAQISAKRRMEGAMEAAGPGMQDVLWRVVCAGEGLEGAEKALGWPKRAGKLVLLMALDRVADQYGIR